MIVLLSGPHITLFILPWGPVIVKMSSLDSALQNRISQCQHIQNEKYEFIFIIFVQPPSPQIGFEKLIPIGQVGMTENFTNK